MQCNHKRTDISSLNYFGLPTWQHSEGKSATLAGRERPSKSRKSYGLFLWRADTHKWISYRPYGYCYTLFGSFCSCVTRLWDTAPLSHTPESCCDLWKCFGNLSFPKTRGWTGAEVCVWATAGAVWCRLFHRNIFSVQLAAVWCDQVCFYNLESVR